VGGIPLTLEQRQMVFLLRNKGFTREGRSGGWVLAFGGIHLSGTCSISVWAARCGHEISTSKWTASRNTS
jgi:hypothetical protein